MPYSFRYEPSTDACLDVRLWGTLTPDEFDEAAESIVPALSEWARILVDAAELDNPTEVLKMFLQARWRPRLPEHLRQAAVVNPRAAAVARAWIRVASPRSAGAQAFRDRRSALDWLLADYQSTTGGS